MSDFGAAIDLQTTASLARAKSPLPNVKVKDADQATKVAKHFEAVFIIEILGEMLEGV